MIVVCLTFALSAFSTSVCVLGARSPVVYRDQAPASSPRQWHALKSIFDPHSFLKGKRFTSAHDISIFIN